MDIALDKSRYHPDVAALFGVEGFPRRGAVYTNEKVKLVQRDEVRDVVGPDY